MSPSIIAIIVLVIIMIILIIVIGLYAGGVIVPNITNCPTQSTQSGTRSILYPGAAAGIYHHRNVPVPAPVPPPTST